MFEVDLKTYLAYRAVMGTDTPSRVMAARTFLEACAAVEEGVRETMSTYGIASRMLIDLLIEEIDVETIAAAILQGVSLRLSPMEAQRAHVIWPEIY